MNIVSQNTLLDNVVNTLRHYVERRRLVMSDPGLNFNTRQDKISRINNRMRLLLDAVKDLHTDICKQEQVIDSTTTDIYKILIYTDWGC